MNPLHHVCAEGRCHCPPPAYASSSEGLSSESHSVTVPVHTINKYTRNEYSRIVHNNYAYHTRMGFVLGLISAVGTLVIGAIFLSPLPAIAFIAALGFEVDFFILMTAAVTGLSAIYTVRAFSLRNKLSTEKELQEACNRIVQLGVCSNQELKLYEQFGLITLEMREKINEFREEMANAKKLPFFHRWPFVDTRDREAKNFQDEIIRYREHEWNHYCNTMIIPMLPLIPQK